MINSTSSQQGTPSTVAPIGPPQLNGVVHNEPVAGDTLSTAASQFLKIKLASEPEVRPEMVAKGQLLAADPSYPSLDVLGRVAQKILQSPDPSEDLS